MLARLNIVKWLYLIKLLIYPVYLCTRNGSIKLELAQHMLNHFLSKFLTPGQKDRHLK